MNSTTMQANYRVEVSGWDASENFFVEKTTLVWRGEERKEISLNARVRPGCVLFVRLLQPTAAVNNIPIAYEAANVMLKDAKRRVRVILAQLRPRDRGEAAELCRAPALKEIA